MDEQDVFSSLNGDLLGGVGNVASTISTQFGAGLGFDTQDFNTEHAQDAIDFEDIELTDEGELDDDNDDQAAAEAAAAAAAVKDPAQEARAAAEARAASPFVFAPSQKEIEREKQKSEAEQRAREQEARDKVVREQKLLQYYYPYFEKDKTLRMHSIFKSEAPKNLRYGNFLEKPFNKRLLIPTRVRIEFEVDDRKSFNRRRNVASDDATGGGVGATGSNSGVVRITEDDLAIFRREFEKVVDEDEDDKDLVLAAAEWDDDAILGLKEQPRDSESQKSQKSGLAKIDAYPFEQFRINDTKEAKILEGKIVELTKDSLLLDMNDPHMYFADNSVKQKTRGIAEAKVPVNHKQLLTRFNVSNDKSYELLKENYHTKIRATLGSLAIDHSLPAEKLQSPYYKVKLTKQQMRSFHRPKFIVRSNTVMSFHKPKVRKRKKDKGKDVKEIFKSTMDLSLGDTGPVYLLEYTEENPLVLSNFGMGSKIINYYRKKTDDDTYRPRGLIGETHVLSVQDRSPFWNFGFVEKGKFVPTLYNQMVRAPVFQHEPKSTDFLLVKSFGGTRTSTRYYLRSINKVFVVGQMFPVVEIPGPHSRKVTTVSKNRLKMIVYRVLNHSEGQRLIVKDISAHFPDQNDMQNRQRLKEFMVYQRAGEDQGFWKIKPGEKLPTEEEIRAMITPEDLCLLESMQVGQQHLEDYAVYSYDKINLDKFKNFVLSFNNKQNPDFAQAFSPVGLHNDDEDGESIEDQLAPWNITRNFIHATQGKAMLQLHGEGEPTGRSEGLSFLRTSMKGGFKSIEEEKGPALSEEDLKNKFNGHSYNVAMQQRAYDDEIRKVWYKQMATLSSEEPPQYKKEIPHKSRYNNRNNKSPAKVLRITRMVRNQYNVLERQTEIIKDERIIHAYLLRKQQQHEEFLQSQTSQTSQSIDLSSVKTPTNEDEKRLLQQELEKLQAQKNSKKVLQSGKGIGKGRNTKRKCALCGAVGHIRTKKSCPMYGKIPEPGMSQP